MADVDLSKGMEMFRDSMTQYHTTQAVNDATEQLKQLNSQQMDRQQALVENERVGQELALRLTSAGAKPEQIQAATQGLMAPASVTVADQGQTVRQQAGFGQQTKEKQMDRDLAIELQKMKNEALVGKKDAKRGGFVTGYQKSYNKEVEKLNQGIQAMDTAEQVLQSGNPVGDQSVGVMFARASGDVGAVSDYAEKKYGGSKALLDRISQAKEEWQSGKISPKNRKFMLELTQTYRQAKSKQKETIADKYANQAHSAASLTGFETTPEELKVMITGEPAKPEPKVETGRNYSKSLNQTQIMYSDGTSKVVPGRQAR